MSTAQIPPALRDSTRLDLLAAWTKGMAPSVVAEKLRLLEKTVIRYFNLLDKDAQSWNVL